MSVETNKLLEIYNKNKAVIHPTGDEVVVEGFINGWSVSYKFENKTFFHLFEDVLNITIENYKKLGKTKDEMLDIQFETFQNLLEKIVFGEITNEEKLEWITSAGLFQKLGFDDQYYGLSFCSL
jgi:hypothetical protein